jgi:magnesium transporter
MVRSRKRTIKPAGSSPGTLLYIGEERSDPVTISYIHYNPVAASEPKMVAVREVRPPVLGGVSWFTVDGVHDVEILRSLGEAFSIHPLVLEDIANTRQRPKIEDFDEYVFISMKMITLAPEDKKLQVEQVSIVFGKDYVVSLLEDEGDVFEPVRQRIKSGKGRIRRLGADYLMYALMDAVVDNYFSVLEDLGDKIEALEEEVVTSPTSATLKDIHRLKRELIFLRRAVWPMRETVNVLLRDETDLVTAETRIFLRDLYDHTIHVIDTVETLRDIVAGMLEVYLSSVSNKLNQVMKVLTVMSSIFIPLTFVVGVYGMNFQYMPELQWHYGYPTVLVGMLVLALSLLAVFRRKGWL